MKIARITEWYRYKDIKDDDTYRIARFNNDNNQQILVFIFPDDSFAYSTNPSFQKSRNILISDKPIQISPELEKKVMKFVTERFNEGVSIPDNDKI